MSDVLNICIKCLDMYLVLRIVYYWCLIGNIGIMRF